MHANWKVASVLKLRLQSFRIGSVILWLTLFAPTSYAQNSAAKPYYDRGLQQYESGDYDAAIRSLTQALNIDRDAYLAYYSRGLAKYKLGNYDGAIADYTSTILMNPQYINADYERAVNLNPQLESTLRPSIRDLRSQLSSSPSPSTSLSSRTQEIVFGAPRLYEHKSGWFSLSIPENWKVEDKSSESEAIVSLYDPTQNAVVVVRVYSPAGGHTQAELGDLLKTFVTERMSSFEGYNAGDLRTQKDGSIGLAFKYNQVLEGKNFP